MAILVLKSDEFAISPRTDKASENEKPDNWNKNEKVLCSIVMSLIIKQ